MPKITELPVAQPEEISGNDIFPLVDEPQGGTPRTKRAKLQDIFALAPVKSINGKSSGDISLASTDLTDQSNIGRILNINGYDQGNVSLGSVDLTDGDDIFKISDKGTTAQFENLYKNPIQTESIYRIDPNLDVDPTSTDFPGTYVIVINMPLQLFDHNNDQTGIFYEVGSALQLVQYAPASNAVKVQDPENPHIYHWHSWGSRGHRFETATLDLKKEYEVLANLLGNDQKNLRVSLFQVQQTANNALPTQTAQEVYATKASLANFTSTDSLSEGFYTKAQSDQKYATQVSLSGYTKTTDLESNYATKSEVTNQISSSTGTTAETFSTKHISADSVSATTSISGQKLSATGDISANNLSALSQLSGLRAIVGNSLNQATGTNSTLVVKGNTHIEGNLSAQSIDVLGSVVVKNTQMIKLSDDIIEVNVDESDNATSASGGGVAVNRGPGNDKASLLWNQQENTWEIKLGSDYTNLKYKSYYEDLESLPTASNHPGMFVVVGTQPLVSDGSNWVQISGGSSSGDIGTIEDFNASFDAHFTDTDGDGAVDAVDPDPDDSTQSGVDADNDGIDDAVDPDPSDPNVTGVDADGDGTDDAIDPDPTDPNVTGTDTDNDGIDDAVDPDPNDPNVTGVDADNDGVDDAVDSDPTDPLVTGIDADSDGVDDAVDTDPTDPNVSGIDADNDGFDDAVDSDPTDPNVSGVDADFDGFDDAIDSDPTDPDVSGVDADADGFDDAIDSDPSDPDVSGVDADGDGVDDAVDLDPTDSNVTADADGDGIDDSIDSDPTDPSVSGVDADGDGVDDAVDSDPTDPYSEFFAPTSKSELQTAVNAWIADETSAKATYGEINTWITTGVTEMNSLFSGKSTFNSDISAWDVSQVTNMSSMFRNASSFNQPLNSWNVEKVENMIQIFQGASSFNQPLNNWNISGLTMFKDMFNNASSFDQDIGDWDWSFASNNYESPYGWPYSFWVGSGLSTANIDKILVAWDNSGMRHRQMISTGKYYGVDGARAIYNLKLASRGWNTLGGTSWPTLDPSVLDTDGDGMPDSIDPAPSDPSILVDDNNDGFDDSTIFQTQLVMDSDGDNWLDISGGEIEGTGEWAISMWVKPGGDYTRTSWSKNSTIIGETEQIGNLQVYGSTSGNIVASVPSQNGILATSGQINWNEWNHFFIALHGNRLRLYVNGVQTSDEYGTNWSPFKLGHIGGDRPADADSTPFQGQITNIMYYHDKNHTGLFNGEPYRIKALYESGPGGGLDVYDNAWYTANSIVGGTLLPARHWLYPASNLVETTTAPSHSGAQLTSKTGLDDLGLNLIANSNLKVAQFAGSHLEVLPPYDDTGFDFAVNYNGTSDYHVVALDGTSSGDILPSNDDDVAFTISAWIRPTLSASSNQPILSWGQSSGAYPNFFQLETHRMFYNGTFWPGAFESNQWHHVLIVREATGLKKIKVYKNGDPNPLHNLSVSGGLANRSRATHLILGKASGNYYNSSIDELAFWNSDQTANLSTIYNGGAPTNLSSLQPYGWWKMGDNDSAVIGSPAGTITNALGPANDMIVGGGSPTFTSAPS